MRRYAGCLAVVLLLSACATQSGRGPGNEAEKAYQERHDYLVSLNDWTLTGRLAADDSKDGGSGSLSWQKSTDSTHMSFRGAMGKGAWELHATNRSARLSFADGREFSAPSISQLVAEHMKSDVPVEALSWWVLGLAWSNSWDERRLDEKGRMTSLRQLGWEVNFSNYKQENQVWLPGKLVARKKDHTVKLAISEWSLQPGNSGPE